MIRTRKTVQSFPVLSILTIGLILLAWWIATAYGFLLPIFLPTPGKTWQALVELVVSGRFASAVAVSFGRILFATALAAITGAVLGIAMGVSSRTDALLSPITQPMRYLPITALIPLLILWFGIGETMKILFLFIGIVFYFIPLVRNAIRSIPEEYIDTARSFGTSKLSTARFVYWPHALPQIIDGFIVVNGIGWTYVILAEIVNARQGLGYMIYIAGRLQRSDEVFAGLILIALVAIGSDRILRAIRERYFYW